MIPNIRGIHPGETAYIVGRGPSLLRITADDFGPGPVIVLNSTIVHVRKLHLPNPIYYMWKDGCLPHTRYENPPSYPHSPCGVIPAEEGEVFITSTNDGSYCGLDFPIRLEIDVEASYGLPWYTMSTPMAVEVAWEMGCSSLVIMGHDAYLAKNTNRVLPDGSMEDDPHAGYYIAGYEAQIGADKHGMPIDWVMK